ncbi:MAG: hypothetical protein OEY85_08120 [Rhodospirillales bacterium]|nr:hypothetical protein [Rhodospirillales bacterium]
MKTIGVITGLRRESVCLSRFPAGSGLRVACAGANAARAREYASNLIDDGCDALLSFGVAGGLTPGLQAGVLIIANEVVSPGGHRYSTNESWRSALGRAVINHHDVRVAALAGSDEAVTSLESKKDLRVRTAAAAVDMESHGVAEAAFEAGVPFLVLRAVADPHDRTIPSWVMAGLDDEGNVRAKKMITGLYKNQDDFWEMLGLAWESRKAMSALRRAAALVGPGFGLD